MKPLLVFVAITLSIVLSVIAPALCAVLFTVPVILMFTAAANNR